MFRTIVIASVAAGTLLFHSPAQAKYDKSCSGTRPNQLDEADIASLKLSARVEIFKDSIKNAQSEGEIQIIATDCPLDGHVIRAVKFPPKLSVAGEGSFRMVEMYGIYVTAAYLRNTEEDDLARGALRQMCIIRTGAAENPLRPPDGSPDSPEITKCMLTAAVMADDDQYAQWLAHKLGVVVPHKGGDNRAASSVQNAIDQMKKIPAAPFGAIDALEMFKRSLEEFPPAK